MDMMNKAVEILMSAFAAPLWTREDRFVAQARDSADFERRMRLVEVDRRAELLICPGR
jgi:hypothetical protein